MVLHEVVSELLVRWLGEHGLLPQVWGQVGVSLANGLVGGLGEVAEGGGGTCGRGVTILNTGHVQKLLGDRGADNSCSSWSRDQTHEDTTASPSHLARDSVGFADLVTPVASPHRDDGQLSQDDGSTDGSCHLLGALHSQTNMTVVVSDGYESLESGSLTGTGLFLDRHNLENFIFQDTGTKESVNNVALLDGQ